MSQIYSLYFIEAKLVDGSSKTLGQKLRSKNEYVPRNERYNNLLDTAYADIVEKRKNVPTSSEMNNVNKKGEKKPEKITQLQTQTTPDTNKTPTVSINVLFFRFEVLCCLPLITRY